MEFGPFYESLEKRHLSELTFAEVRRGVTALSRWYVERRSGLGRGVALDGAGKRAAFAMFYGPLHFLTVGRVVRELGANDPAPSSIVDLGCGTGVSGAAWAVESTPVPYLRGIDRSAWAAGETRWCWKRLGLRGTARSGKLEDVRPGRRGSAVLAAYVVNELDGDERESVLQRLLAAARGGVRVLVVEPISRRTSPWWATWAEALGQAGGRADTWRFETVLPERLRLLGKAAGLNPRELSARTLFVG